MEMTRGMKWATEDCYKAHSPLAETINGPSNTAYIFRDDEDNKDAISEAERALSYYDHHGYNGVDNNNGKGEEVAA